MIKWFKTLSRIVRSYDSDQDIIDQKVGRALKEVLQAQKFIKHATTINADVSLSHRDDSQIIVIGRYRSRDYIQTYTVSGDNFKGLIEQLKEMQKYGVVRRVDAIPAMREVIDRETDWI